MINGLARRFAKASSSDDWPLEQGLKPEVEGTGGLIRASPRPLGPAWSMASFSPVDSNSTDYYKGIVEAAIKNGGRYAGHFIPTPWLQMILAGLEFRRIDPETLWEGAEAGTPADSKGASIPSYSTLFPSERTIT